jgi:hypothetical protein
MSFCQKQSLSLFEVPQPLKPHQSLEHPVSVDIEAPAPEIPSPTDLQGRLAVAEAWLAQQPRRELKLGNVSLEDLKELYSALFDKGIKVR